MNYDFDMLSVTPKDIQTKYAQTLTRFGMTDMARQKLAMFRDPNTVRALAGASEAVRDCFVASGFALNGFDSGIGNGRFHAADEDERTEVLERLQANLASVPADAQWNGFDIEAFFDAAGIATVADPRRRRFDEVRHAVLPPMRLAPSDRVRTRATSRPVSTPAPSY